MLVFKIIIALLFLGYALVAATVYFTQDSMVYNPSRTMEGTPADIGLHHEEIELVTPHGAYINGWWIPHPQPRATLLFCHGNAGNISHRGESLRIFHNLGLAVFIFDYSGYGKSTGKPSEKALKADTKAAWDWLVQEKGIAPKTIILFGRSLGGGTAAALAAELEAEKTAPRGIIMESTFSSLTDVGTTLFPWLPVRLLAKSRFNSVKALQKTKVPALFIHSKEDNTVPYALGRKLFDHYSGPKDFLHIEGSHNRGFLDTGAGYSNGLARYLNRLDQTQNDSSE